MPEPWTSKVVAEMHANKIKQKDLAKAIGWTPEYVSMVLNGKRNPSNAQKKIEMAIASIVSTYATRR